MSILHALLISAAVILLGLAYTSLAQDVTYAPESVASNAADTAAEAAATAAEAPNSTDGVSETVKDKNSGNCSGKSICQTEECVSTAARIIETLDPSIDPCDDFYKFACGGWLKNEILPPHRPAVATLSDTDKHLAAARNVLQDTNNPGNLTSVRKARDLYAACMKYSLDPREGRSLKNIIFSRFGVWPKDETWDKSKFSLMDYLIETSHLDIHPLFKFYVDLFWDFNEKGDTYEFHALTVGLPQLGLPDWVYRTQTHVAVTAYKENILNNIMNYANYVNAWDGPADVLALIPVAEEIYSVEKTLANFVITARPENLMMFTMKEMQAQFGQLLNWSAFTKKLVATPDIGITDITSAENVMVPFTAYLSSVASYFNKLPARIQANYIIWRVIDSLNSALVRKGDTIKTLLQQSVKGVTANPSAEETCVIYASTTFNLVLHRLMYTQVFPPEEVAEIHKLLREVHQQFGSVVDEHAWVDKESAAVIKKKSEALELILVSYQQAMDDKILEETYANVTYKNFNFIEMDMVNREQTFQRNLRLLRRKFEYTSSDLPFEIVARNVHVENTLEFSAIVFDPPIYSRHVPQSVNYGSIGTVFGHEIIHAFDSATYNINDEGVSGNWWSKKTVATFFKRQKCMIDQYSSYYSKLAQLYINGTKTLAENIADNGGIKLAYRAYKKFVAERGSEEPTFPGLHYTHDQLFFISFAQLWCSIETKQIATESIAVDVHTPGEFRVIGTFQNSKEFAATFNCPANSKMNPEKKCEVW